MAENMDSVCRRITTYIGVRLRTPTEFINHIPWQEREKLFDATEIQVCWICGLPYVLKAAEPGSRIELLAAPVMIGERYLNRPIYFSDIVVSADSRFQSFADLRGASWVYNEPRSQSGFNIVRHHLRMLGESLRYFGQIFESGAHQTSLRMILDRQPIFRQSILPFSMLNALKIRHYAP
jgi:phosphonate transport system substrate-binding protein